MAQIFSLWYSDILGACNIREWDLLFWGEVIDYARVPMYYFFTPLLLERGPKFK